MCGRYEQPEALSPLSSTLPDSPNCVDASLPPPQRDHLIGAADKANAENVSLKAELVQSQDALKKMTEDFNTVNAKWQKVGRNSAQATPAAAGSWAVLLTPSKYSSSILHPIDKVTNGAEEAAETSA